MNSLVAAMHPAPALRKQLTLTTRYAYLALSCIVAPAACTMEGEASPPQSLATMLASGETRSALGIDRWTTYEDDSQRHIHALDGRGRAIASLLAVTIDPDTIRIEDEQADAFAVLSRDGSVSASSDDSLSVLARALYSDSELSWFGAVEAEGDTSKTTVAANSYALTSLAIEVDEHRSGGLFGYRETFDVGWGCGGTCQRI